LTKTFFYYVDERNPSLGRKIIETRIQIKKNDAWIFGTYVWNNEQTEAFLDTSAPVVPVNYTDGDGNGQVVNYKVPLTINCTQCHENNNAYEPLGPKARNLNKVVHGKNQLQDFIDKTILIDAPIISDIDVLPTWNDTSYTLEERSRAYMDVNCASCHQSGGFHDSNLVANRLQLNYETPFTDSNIDSWKDEIVFRMGISPEFSISMPLVGTTILHQEGIQLIEDYINTLD